MNPRTLVLLLTVALITVLAVFNWNALATPSEVSLGLLSFEAPLGVLMLGLTVLLGIFFVAYVLSLQGSVLLETRRHAKEMQAQRELADKAEASRFTALRDELIARIDASGNGTAAHIAQLEDRLERARALPIVSDRAS